MTSGLGALLARRPWFLRLHPTHSGPVIPPVAGQFSHCSGALGCGAHDGHTPGKGGSVGYLDASHRIQGRRRRGPPSRQSRAIEGDGWVGSCGLGIARPSREASRSPGLSVRCFVSTLLTASQCLRVTFLMQRFRLTPLSLAQRFRIQAARFLALSLEHLPGLRVDR